MMDKDNLQLLSGLIFGAIAAGLVEYLLGQILPERAKFKHVFSIVIAIAIFGVITVTPIDNWRINLNGDASDPLSPTSTPKPQETVITNTPAATLARESKGTLVFDEDFDDDDANGFSFETNNWEIVDDGSGNKVLEAKKANNWSYARFGPTNFSNGTIEYRVKLLSRDTLEHSGMAFLVFREQSHASYVFATDFENSTFDFKYTGSDSSYKWLSINNGTINSNLEKDKWYSIQVTASGDKVTVYIDDRLIINTNDSRAVYGQIKFAATSFNTIVQFDDVRVWSTSK